MTSQASIIKPECFTQYKNACDASTKLGEFTHEVRKRILEYARARREGARTETIHQIIFSVTDSHLGINETGMWDGCRKMLTGLLQDIAALAEGILDPEISVKGTFLHTNFATYLRTYPFTLTHFMLQLLVTKPDKVWIKRAKDLKAEVIVNVDAEQKAQSLQDQVLKLVKEAKLKVCAHCFYFFAIILRGVFLLPLPPVFLLTCRTDVVS
jgi:hypothetical protein